MIASHCVIKEMQDRSSYCSVGSILDKAGKVERRRFCFGERAEASSLARLSLYVSGFGISIEDEPEVDALHCAFDREGDLTKIHRY
jgi:hypothetical protein